MSHSEHVLPKDLGKAAVVFIEFQREWLDDDGKINFLMKDRRQFSDALDAGRTLLASARRHELPIVHAGLQFAPGHPELGIDGKGLRGAIKRFGTFASGGKGAEFASDFAPGPGEFVVRGRTGASAFSGSNLDAFLRSNRIDEILICGFALHVCVESTLRAAHDLGYDTWLVEDACAAFTPEQRRHVLDDVVHHYGERITTTEIAAELARTTAG